MNRIQFGSNGTDTITNRTRVIDRFINDVNKYPLLSVSEEQELAIKSSNGDLAAREKLVVSNLRFVISIAKMYSRNNTHILEDLINEGNMGLMEAAENFDPKFGFKFISHAVWYVRKNMTRYMADKSRTIRLPQNKSVALKKMKDIELKLLQELQRDPTFDELFERLNNHYNDDLGLNLIRESLMEANSVDVKPAMLSGAVNDNEFNPITFPIDVIDGDYNNLDLKVDIDHFMYHIKGEVELLKPRERDIFNMKHGLNGYRPTGLVEIGKKYGVTKKAIRQILKRTNVRLRLRLEKYLEKK